jgi:DNA polymerase
MTESGCWRGKGDSTPYRPGVPEEVSRARNLKELFREMVCCTRCDLAPGRTQVVTGAGPETARVVFIGEGPGAQEDLSGKPFVGRAGQLLDRLLVANKLSRDEIFITNIVSCRPPGNRTPRVGEIRAHSPWLDEQLRLIAPHLVATLGRVALTYFIPKARITELRGQPQTVQKSGRSFQLLPLFHPAAALRRPELVPVLEEDFAKIPGLLTGLGPRG